MRRREPQPIGDIILQMAADPAEPYSKILRQCPFIQNELLRQGKMTEEEVLRCQCERNRESILDTLLDGQDVMMRLHISPPHPPDPPLERYDTLHSYRQENLLLPSRHRTDPERQLCDVQHPRTLWKGR